MFPYVLPTLFHRLFQHDHCFFVPSFCTLI